MATAKERKQKSRERQKAMDIKVVEVKLSATERETLLHLCEVRGGITGAYEMSEYISTLIRRDKERLAAQLAELGHCDFCDRPKPEGCGGKWKGLRDCYHTVERKKISL